MISTVSRADVENEIVHRQGTVVKFISRIGPVHDELTLHALVYLAQCLSILDSLYEFDFSQNVPISPDLSSDLYDLVQKGVLVDTHRPARFTCARMLTGVPESIQTRSPLRAGRF